VIVAPLQDEPRVPRGFVGLVASQRLRSDPERVAAVVAGDGLPWDEVPHPDATELRRYEVDLRLRVGGEEAGLTTFRKAAFLDLGTPSEVGGAWECPIGWRASGSAPLFPVFSGTLRIGAGELRIEGLYAPPGGIVGRAADRMLLHVAANATARWLLGELDRAASG
jgi:hypothetical protein